MNWLGWTEELTQGSIWDESPSSMFSIFIDISCLRKASVQTHCPTQLGFSMFEPSREATICSSASPFFLRSQGCVGGHQEAPMEQWHSQKTLGLLGLQPTECWDWTAKLNTYACGLGMFWAWLPSIENLSLMVRWFIMYVKKLQDESWTLPAWVDGRGSEKTGFGPTGWGINIPSSGRKTMVSPPTRYPLPSLPLHTWAITKERSHSPLCQSQRVVHRSFLFAACFHPHNSRVLHTSEVFTAWSRETLESHVSFSSMLVWFLRSDVPKHQLGSSHQPIEELVAN